MRGRLFFTIVLLLVGADYLAWRHMMNIADQLIVRTFDPLNSLISTLEENEKKVYNDGIVHSGTPHITTVFIDPVLSWVNACQNRPIARKSAFVQSLVFGSFRLNYGAKEPLKFQSALLSSEGSPTYGGDLSVLSCDLHSPGKQSKKI